MRTQLAAACAGLALIAATATAQLPTVEIIKNRAAQIEFYSSNYGMFGLNVREGAAGFFYPRGSKKTYLFGAGLWFGAQKRVEGTLRPLTFVTYNPNSGSSWAMPGEYGDDSTSLFPYIYNSIDYSRDIGRYIGSGPARSIWPLRRYTPSDITPMRPGIFAPLEVDRTGEGAFVGGVDEQIVSRFNDRDLRNYEVRDSALTGFPLGLQFQQTIYAWSTGNYAPAVMIQYQIVNVSSDTLFDCIAAQVSDPDIAQTNRNRSRYWSERPELRAAYAWAEQGTDEYRALGMGLIEAPMTDANGFVDNSNRQGYREQGRVGAFPNWLLENDPSISRQRYDFMNTPSFASGDSIGEQRALMASTKFSMRPGDTAYYTMVYVVIDTLPKLTKTVMRDGGRHLSEVPMTQASQLQLEEVIKSITYDYYERGSFSSDIPSSTPVPQAAETGMSLAAVPNPASERTSIRMNLSGSTGVALRITNTLGETMLARTLENPGAGTHEETIDVSALPAGLYFALVQDGGRTATIRFAVTR